MSGPQPLQFYNGTLNIRLYSACTDCKIPPKILLYRTLYYLCPDNLSALDFRPDPNLF